MKSFRMKPGRFVSLWFLYLGALELSRFVLGLALGEIQFNVYGLAVFLPGFAALIMGVDRVLHPAHEDWPAEYGLWTYAAALFLVGMTAWLLYNVASLLAPGLS